MNIRNPLKTTFYYSTACYRVRPFANLDVLISSHGGVGTTFIAEFLGQSLRTNDPADRDHIKHLPLPPRRLDSRTRILYVYGDPVDSVLSLFRRDYARVQGCKNGVFNPRYAMGSLEDYARGGRDDLGITRHLKAWTAGSNYKNPAIAVNYDALWNRARDIVDFLELPRGSSAQFPARRKRKSVRSDYGLDVIERLECIYGAYRDITTQLGDFAVIRE